MPSFVYPNLLWALALVAIPVLIHLINLVRQRRVAWAAMEFLLASQRKNSAWIRLKELLLLLLRIGAFVGVVLVLAEPLWNREFALRLAGRRTHRIVLLDDSYSMSDRWADTSAFDAGKQVVERLGEQAALAANPQRLTLVRFSAAPSAGRAAQPDLVEEPVDSDFASRLSAILAVIAPSEQAVGPEAALALADTLTATDRGDDVVVTLISDFRKSQWNEPRTLAQALHKLAERGHRLELVQCVDAEHANLAITSLEPAEGSKAAGVSFSMAVTIANKGPQAAREVAVMFEQDGQLRPALVLDEIAAGESQRRTFPVFFSTAGEHGVAVHLPADSVAADNHRYQVLQMPLAVPVLIIEGAAGEGDGRFLQAALAPGGAVKTGVSPQLEGPTFLNSADLNKFHTIYLTDVPRLDDAGLKALEKFVRSGGGLGVFMGPRCQTSWYTDAFYRKGQGPFPLPLAGATQLLVDRLEKAPDLEITDHPMFRVFRGERNSFLSAVTFDRFFAAPPDWKPAATSATRVIARLRNGSPLAVEQDWGQGRVLTVLSTAAPVWNNWGLNPSFVVAMLEMQSRLDGRPVAAPAKTVTAPLEVVLDPTRYAGQARLVPPLGGTLGPRTLDLLRTPEGMKLAFADAWTSGIYDVQLSTADNQSETRRFAFNVDTAESEMARFDAAQLSRRLPGIRFDYRPAAQYSAAAHDLAGSNLTDMILYVLLALLVGEQLLASVASYHPRAATRSVRR